MALKLLGQFTRAPQRITTLEAAIAAAKKLPRDNDVSFWIFREKRHTPGKHSRYKQMCALLGIGHPRWHQPTRVPVPRRQNARANSSTGLSTPAQGVASQTAQASLQQLQQQLFDTPVGGANSTPLSSGNNWFIE